MVERQSLTVERLTDTLEELEHPGHAELAHLRGEVKTLRRAQRRVAGDLDAVSDALDILITHVGDQLPKQARLSILAKLQRRQRDEVTGEMPAHR